MPPSVVARCTTSDEPWVVDVGDVRGLLPRPVLPAIVVPALHGRFERRVFVVRERERRVGVERVGRVRGVDMGGRRLQQDVALRVVNDEREGRRVHVDRDRALRMRPRLVRRCGLPTGRRPMRAPEADARRRSAQQRRAKPPPRCVHSVETDTTRDATTRPRPPRARPAPPPRRPRCRDVARGRRTASPS